MLSRHLRLYLAYALVVVLIMTYQSGRGPLRPLAYFAYVINSISHTITLGVSTITGTIDAITREAGQNQKLKAQVRDLTIRLSQFEELRKENSRLRDMLAFKISEPRQVAIATVISRSARRWSNSLMIDKGTIDGVEKDMAVITPEGLVGKILESRPYYSIVLLITDSRFAAAVRLQDNRAEAVLVGDGTGSCIVKYLNADATAKKGGVFVTSGLDALFPSGIPTGTITSIDTPEKALFHMVEATPLARLDKLEEVIVVER